MKKKNHLFLFLGLGLCSGTLLVDRFYSLPDLLAIILGLCAIVFFFIHLVISRKNKASES